MRISECRTCKAEIIWTVTTNGKKMPVDAEPDAAGTFVLTEGMNGVFAKVDNAYSGPKHQSHFATCAHAAEHRRKP
jgi:hypothetical protein